MLTVSPSRYGSEKVECKYSATDVFPQPAGPVITHMCLCFDVGTCAEAFDGGTWVVAVEEAILLLLSLCCRNLLASFVWQCSFDKGWIVGEGVGGGVGGPRRAMLAESSALVNRSSVDIYLWTIRWMFNFRCGW